MTDQAVTLAAALDDLHAVTLAPATACAHPCACSDPQDCALVRRYAWYNARRQRWQSLCRSALLSLAAVTKREPGMWEPVSARDLPRRWSPGRAHRFTIDFETGREVA